jgi:hypothetical protein
VPSWLPEVPLPSLLSLTQRQNEKTSSASTSSLVDDATLEARILTSCPDPSVLASHTELLGRISQEAFTTSEYKYFKEYLTELWGENHLYEHGALISKARKASALGTP